MLKISTGKRTILICRISYLLLISIIGLNSCNEGTEFDNFVDYSYNKLPSNISIPNDSVGLNPFLAEKYVGITAKEHRLLLHARDLNLYEIKGIALPESDNTSISLLDSSIVKIIFDADYNNYFYGYPSVIKTDAGTMVVAEKRVSETSANQYSDNFMITSTTPGKWSVTDFFKFAPYGLTWNNSRPLVGRTPEGKIVMKGKGLLVSNGNFQSWRHYPYAFQQIINSGKNYLDCGPEMTYSSKFGLFFGTGQVSADTAAAIPMSLGTLFSVDPDLGQVKVAKYRWIPKVMKSDSTFIYLAKMEFPVFYSVEHPDLSAHKYDIVGFGLSDNRIYEFIYNYKEGHTFDSIRFDMIRTNITGSLIRESPVGIIYNPVTKRFEVMVSSPSELDLYSISPEDLLTGKQSRVHIAEWKFECALLKRDVTIRAQGMYPVSSVIDEVNKTQTVYFHAGQEYPARSGIFQLTRTLETSKISTFVTSYRNYLSSVRF